MASGTRSGRRNPTSDDEYQPSKHQPLQNRLKGHQSQRTRPQSQAKENQPPSNKASTNQPPTKIPRPCAFQPEDSHFSGVPRGNLSHETALSNPPSSDFTENRTGLVGRQRETPTGTSLGSSRNAEKSSKNKGKSRSSNKSSQTTFDTAPSIASIKLRDLEESKPRVVKRSFEMIKQQYRSMPGKVEGLYKKLKHIPSGVIPFELQEAYRSDAATPRKSRDSVSWHDFAQPNQLPYPPCELRRLKLRLDNVLENATWNDQVDAHERNWGALAHTILEEFAVWDVGRRMRIINVETCSIEPSPLHTTMPAGQRYSYSSETNVTTSSEASDARRIQAVKDDNQSTEDKAISKMVDWCVGLKLSPVQDREVGEAFGCIGYNERSLNQSLSFIKKMPLFLDIEVKKRQPGRDPELNLAIWASGALKKKLHHHWDTSMPMPAIVIEGHHWKYYLFFYVEGHLVMMGPNHLGDTIDMAGVWKIVYRLHVLIEWGTNEYSQWFENNIVRWARGINAGEQQGGAQKGSQ